MPAARVECGTPLLWARCPAHRAFGHCLLPFKAALGPAREPEVRLAGASPAAEAGKAFLGRLKVSEDLGA